MPGKLLSSPTTRRWLYLLVLGLLPAAGPARAQEPPPACCGSRYPVAALGRVGTVALGREYRRLRQLRCAACSHYGSDLQKLLEALGNRLDNRPASEIRRVLGPPDVVRAGRLVYYWRGEHDYLYFRLTPAGRGRRTWYYAYE